MRPVISILLACLLYPAQACSAELRVAVASNFRHAAESITAAFHQSSQHRVTLISGSTGKHYAQVIHGAPFDVLLAADRKRPELLEQAGLAVSGSRFTYAIGRLVLWSPSNGLVDEGGSILESGSFRHLAIANPELAPYGEAARDALQSLGLWSHLEGRLVRGENVAQAFQFVSSGNAELGFVAASQLRQPGVPEGSSWRVDPALHQPIEQQAVLLKDSEHGRQFLAFLRGPQTAGILQEHGYGFAHVQ